MLRFSALVSLVLAATGGCAQGSRAPREGTMDSGPGLRDAGMDAPAVTADTGSRDGGGGGTDAGVDSGPHLVRDAGDDAGSDAGCTSAAECSDGLVCNGTERCETGRCVAGTPVVCDDGIACTTDGCTEPDASCEYVADDTRCGAGESCTTSVGCMAGCSESPCKLVSPQCGCATGQGCYVDSTGSRLCATAGANGEGAACSGLTSCAPGNLCINIDSAGGSTPVCLKFCSSDTQCGGGLCLYTLDDGMGGALPGVKLCTHPCNPVTQIGCRAGAYCDVFRESMGAMRFFTDCTAPVTGSGTQGATCTTVDDCAPGYTCVDPDGSGTQCLKWCNVTTDTGCTGGRLCYGFMTPLVTSMAEWGVCF